MTRYGTSIRFLVSNALSLLGNSVAGIALPLIVLATTGDALAAGTLALVCAIPQVMFGYGDSISPGSPCWACWAPWGTSPA